MEESETKMTGTTRVSIEALGERLKKVVEGFELLKANGVDEEIMIAWIIYKTRMSRKSVEGMLKAQEEFYQRLLRDEMIKEMED